MKFCLRCVGTRWVCEAHPVMPWEGAHGCSCGAPGEPCPVCNRTAQGDAPAMPDGFKAETRRDVDLSDTATDLDEVEIALARIAALFRGSIH